MILNKVSSSWGILIFIIILYGNTVSFGFINDDFYLVGLDFVSAYNEVVNGVHTRPLWHFSYPIVNLINSSSYFHHTINILLFIISIFEIRKYLIKHFSPSISIYILLFYISLPWLVFPIAWISQRNDLIMIYFFFLSINSYDANSKSKSIIFLILSFLSKVNVVLTPLYFIYREHKQFKKSKWIYIFSSVQLIFLLISARSLHIANKLVTRTSDLNIIENIGLKSINYLTGLSSLIIPFPFFINKVHFIFYLILISTLIFLIKKNNKFKEDFILLFILTSLPLAIAPGLRIAIITSFFLLCVIFHRYTLKKQYIGIILFFLFITHNILSGIESKNNFNSGVFNINSKYQNNSEIFYNNNFYEKRREFLTEIKSNFR